MGWMIIGDVMEWEMGMKLGRGKSLRLKPGRVED
jgi:hypothetical protein